MGIPYYFYAVVAKNGNIIKDELKQCTRLFLDFNSIIHCCSAAVVSKNPTGYTHQTIFEEIVKYTITVAEMCKPSELLYIAVDGVAPRAKIQQQRKRRYMSAYRTHNINAFKGTHGLPVSTWDSNCITPGTKFMTELDSYLKNYFAAQNMGYMNIVSGHTEAGEGEHKIIKYIKDNNDHNKVDVIYGLDADLIMLSLSCDKNNIYLMREANDFSKNVTNDLSNTTKQLFFRYLNVDALRTSISKHLYNTNDISYMYDYIFMCFFLGNDFIPNMTFLKIKNGAVDLLCDIYKNVYSKLQENLVKKDEQTHEFTVNIQFLQHVCEVLSKVEHECMKTAIEQHSQHMFNPQKRFTNKIDKFIYELESYPLVKRYPNLIAPHTDPQWRAKYYHYLLGSSSSSVIKHCTNKFIEGLLWITNYYFNGIYDDNWFYPYDYSPCASDLYKYICTMNKDSLSHTLETLKMSQGFTITPLLQMLMVLPPQSQSLIPDEYKYMYSSVADGCVHYFPCKFEFSTFLKTQLWECHPILPIVNLQYIRDCITEN